MNKKITNVLNQLEKRAKHERENWRSIPHDKRMSAITKNTGIFYNIILRAQKVQRILEIGTSTGYSTLWFADAIAINKKTESKIITIERNQEKIEQARKNFQKAGVSSIIEIKSGDAKNVLPELVKNFRKTKKYFDFVFIDADKEEYPYYFDICLPMVKKGGIIAADNILFPRRFNKHMKKYVKKIEKNGSVQSTTVPIGNGEEISVKIR